MSKNVRRKTSLPTIKSETESNPEIEAAVEITTEEHSVVEKDDEPSIKSSLSPRNRFLIGSFFVLSGVFFALAFLSYSFFWWIDYDTLRDFKFSEIWQNQSQDLRVFGGKFGGWIAYFFVQMGFGVSAIILPIGLILVGLQLLKLKSFNWLKLFFKGSFILLFISLLLGSIPFLQRGAFSILSGEVGFQISEYLKGIAGNLGFYSLMLFSLICFLVFTRLIHPPTFNSKKAKEDGDLNDTDNLNEDVIDTPRDAENIRRAGNIYIPAEDRVDDFFELSNNDNSSLNTISTSFASDTTANISPETPADESSITQANNIMSEPEPTALDTSNTAEKEPEDDIELIIEESKPEAEGIIPDPEPKVHYGVNTPYDPTLDLKDFHFPTIELLEDFGNQNSQKKVENEELLSNKKRIVDTLQNYNIEISQIKATIGPTVTLYEIVPAAGVRISKIKNLEDDIALSLSALGIRIIAPIPGKGTIGIEVPNQNKQIVPMRDMIECDKFRNGKFDLPIALGKTISNDPYVTDLAKMPHLLVAGATGQGKSVGLNAIIASLLYKKHPAELKFVMVDPKKVELSLFNKIERHYLAKLPDAEEAIITDTRKVVRTLNSLCIEMDNRYDLLKNAEVKNIREYNHKFISRRLNPQEGHRFLPYIVLIIDEFADLIMTAGKEIEMPIARLAQLARAIGIHLVIATQRPSVNIITGTIKANFPARIAFKVSSKIDSRTILDGPGADQLIGRGDMLLSTGNELVRIQCAYIDTPEIERITEFIGRQRAYPHAYELPECPEDGQDTARVEGMDNERDSLFEDVAHFVVSSQQGSTSSVQRKFKLGYNRAGRIIDQLEDAGIVGPLERNTREVRIKDPIALENLLNADRS